MVNGCQLIRNEINGFELHRLARLVIVMTLEAHQFVNSRFPSDAIMSYFLFLSLAATK